MEYSQEVYNDTIIQLNVSDSLLKLSIVETIINYPVLSVYTFKDNYNNSISIQYEYSIKFGLITNTITSKMTSSKNGKASTVCRAPCEARSLQVQFIETTFSSIPLLNLLFPGNDLEREFMIDSNQIHTNHREAVYSNTTLILTQITTPNQSENLKLRSLYVKYSDSGVTKTQASIDQSSLRLNPIPQFIFSIFKSLIYIFSFIGVISDFEGLEYQIMILEPLILLSYLINTIVGVTSWVIGMGLFLTLSLIFCITFIYSYITTKDIFKCINRFVELSSKIINSIIIQPILWIYEGLLKLMQILR